MVFAVCVLVVAFLPVAYHRHDIGKHRAWPVVLVCVEEYAQSFKLVHRPKHLALLGALFGHPHGHAIGVEVAFAVDFEFKLDLMGATRQLRRCYFRATLSHLPVRRGERYLRE